MREDEHHTDFLEPNLRIPSDSESASLNSRIATPAISSSPKEEEWSSCIMEELQTFVYPEWNTNECYNNFFQAVAEGNVGRAHEELKHGASLRQQTDAGRSSVYVAMLHNRPQMMEWLLAQGANPHHATDGHQIIVYAAMRIHDAPRYLQILMNHGAVPTHRENTDQMWCAFHHAVVHNRLEAIDFLVSKGVSVELKSIQEKTPLILAASAGKLETVKLLLAKGANLFARSHNGGTALAWAAFHGHFKIVEYLTRAGLEVNDRGTPFTPLVVAARKGQARIVEYLITQGAEIDSWDQGHPRVTPAMEAAANGEVEVLDILISHGANLELRNLHENTVLEVAFKSGNQNTARLLLNTLQGTWYPQKQVSLELVLSTSPEAIRTLMRSTEVLHHKLYPELTGQDDMAWISWILEDAGELVQPIALNNLLFVAILDGKAEVVQLLLELGADVDKPTLCNKTPILVAVLHGQLTIAQMLLKAGADPTKPTWVDELPHGWITPLQKAFKILDDDLDNDTSMVDLLLNTGRCKIMQGPCMRSTPFSYVLDKTHEWQDGIADILIFRMLQSVSDVNSDRAANNDTLLHTAVSFCRDDLIDILLQRGANIHAQNTDSYTPLLSACSNPKNTSTARFLLTRGADPSIPNTQGQTAAHVAAQHGNTPLLKHLLLTHPTLLNSLDSSALTPLISAISAYHLPTALHLLTHHAPKLHFMTLTTRRTALHYACDIPLPPSSSSSSSSSIPTATPAMHHDLITSLLTHYHASHSQSQSHRLDINAQDSQGYTALALLCRATGSRELVAAMLATGADPRVKAPKGSTACGGRCV